MMPRLLFGVAALLYCIAGASARVPVRPARSNYKILLANALNDSAGHAEALSRSDYFVAGPADSQLFVRRVTTAARQQLPMLLVPGGSPPSEVIFDLPVPAYSLAEDLARMGLDVFLMDPRGWGRSTAAAASGETPGDSKQVTADIQCVVDDIRRVTNQSRIVHLMRTPAPTDSPRRRACSTAGINRSPRLIKTTGVTRELRKFTAVSRWRVTRLQTHALRRA
jgi:hypothetical protein